MLLLKKTAEKKFFPEFIYHKWKQITENRFEDTGEEGGGSGMDGEFGIGRCKLLHLEWISKAVLLYSTRNYIQSLGLEHMEDRVKKRICVCIYIFYFFIVISPIQFFFPAVQHGDQVTLTCIHSFFSHYHAPS